MEELPESERYPVVSQCEGVTLRAGTPRRIYERTHSTCGEEYSVDFVVEGGPGDAMLLDLFQSHTLWDWEPEVRGDRVRHKFTLRMMPWSRYWSHFVPARAGARGHEPIILQRCPEGEGEGSVLACTNRGCDVYDDVVEVPPLEPEDLEVAFTVPPESLHSRPIQAGETAWVPLTYRVYRPLAEEVTLRVGSTFGYVDPEFGEQYVDVEVFPPEIRLPAGWTRTETVSLGVRVTRFDYERMRADHNITSRIYVPLRVVLEGTWKPSRCVSVPQVWVSFKLEEPE